MSIEQDRGRSFQVDVMDNEETLGMALGALTGEYLRTKVVPEVDAYRFAKYASWAGTTQATPADIVVGTTDVPGLIGTAESAMGDAEVPEDGRILFVSWNTYEALKSKITRYIDNSVTDVRNVIEMYEQMRVIRVPKGRFNTGITLLDGTSSGETAGGFTVTAGSFPINFMIVHPSAVVQVVKHVVPRLFSPEVNQQADAWKYDYRIYHDAFVEANKVGGIYVHHAATANT